MAVDWSALTDALFSATLAPETITYSRESDTVSVSAFRNTQTAQYMSDESLETLQDEVMFSVVAATLLFDETAVTPAKLDKITDDGGFEYLVQYHEKDSRRLTYRIFTKRIDS